MGIIKALKVSSLIVFSIVFGLFGLSLLFSDLAPGESLLSRLVMAALFFLVTGIIIGYLNRTTWLISGLIGWGGVLLALQSLLNSAPNVLQTIILMFTSVVPAFLGGYLGSILGRKWPLGNAFHRFRRK